MSETATGCTPPPLLTTTPTRIGEMAMGDSTQPGEEKPSETPESLRKQRKREYDRQKYLQNKDRIAEYGKAYREANAEKIREEARRRYWFDPERHRLENRKSAKKNRAKNTAREREWRKKNKDKVRGYYLRHVKKKLREDDLFRLQQNVRTRMCAALAKASVSKSSRTLAIVGCTAAELRQHLQSKFQPGMTWENRGRHGWHIDHIIPLAKFDLTDPEQQAAAFHYTNLQPLWARDNLSKSDKVPGQLAFGFAYAAKIADGVSRKKKRGRSGDASRQHGNDRF